jgi:F5/8 type C domain-containing protein/Big-like domain-containing protein/beta-propeller repeat-containing protein
MSSREIALAALLAMCGSLALSSVSGAQARFTNQGLVYSARTGGGPVVADASGNVYIVESAPSPGFPGTPGVYVARLDPEARTLVYRTFIGPGSGAALAIDESGNAYVAGAANPAIFPATARFTAGAGTRVAFVTKVSSSGQIVYSAVVGGTDAAATGVAVDFLGNAYVTGIAATADFPTTPGAYDASYNGGDAPVPTDAFIFKLEPGATALLYSTLLGGSRNDDPVGIAVDSAGNAYVGGTTSSLNFPWTPNAFEMVARSGQDVFFTKLNPAGSALLYSTALGGYAGADEARAFAIGPSGEAYLAGVTTSFDFPVTAGAARRQYIGTGLDGFVLKLGASGSFYAYGTYLGGTDVDQIRGLAVDENGDAYVTGGTISTDFPVTPGAARTIGNLSQVAFATKLDGRGAILYSTVFAGEGTAAGQRLSVDPNGDMYVTAQASPDFPTTADTPNTSSGGPLDPFVLKLVPRVSLSRAATASSNEAAGLGPSFAVDAVAATRWSSEFADPQSITIDLGGPAAIDRVVLHWEAAYATGYDVQVGDDAQTWTTVYRTAAGDGGIDDLRGLSATGRYVRILGWQRATPWGYSLWEVDVYGTPIVVNLPPEVTITAPADNAVFGNGALFSFTASASDPDGAIARVVFEVDGGLYGNDTAAPYGVVCCTPELEPGEHQLTATAFDRLGASSHASIRISVLPGGSRNIALGQPVTASSVERAGLAALLAVDGSPTSRWSSTFSDPQWIRVDFGRRMNVTGVVLDWEAAYATAFDIQMSDDDSTWTTILSVTNGTGGRQPLLGLSAEGRYLRILGKARGTEWGYSLWELEAYGSTVEAATNNLAKGRPTMASSSESAELTPERATDGQTATRWSSAFADDQWIGVDLGALYDLTRIVLEWEAAFAEEYAIEVSNDGSTWRTVRRVTGEGGYDAQSDIQATARYVRMHGIRRATPWGFSLWEFAVYGTPPVPRPNLALEARATASSIEGPSLEADFARDGSTGTRWSSAFDDNQWIAFDLGDSATVRRVVLHWEAAYATRYSIEISENGASNWITLAAVDDGDGGVDDLTVNGTGRFLRVSCLERATPWGFSLWEVEIHGDINRVNLLTNPGFEDGLSSPLGWQKSSWEPSAVFTWDAGIAHAGARSVRIDAPAPNDASWLQTVPVTPFTTYVLSAWIKTQGIAQSGTGATLGFDGTWSHTTSLFGTNDWTFVTMAYDSGAATTLTVQARIGFWAGMSSGTAWFDDIRVRPVLPTDPHPSWKILVLIYGVTDFSFVDSTGAARHVVGQIPDWQLEAATANATRFVTDDIPALDSGHMIPELTIRYPGTLRSLSELGGGFWPSPSDVQSDRDPAFDSVIAIWQPTVIDQGSGQQIWIGSAAGLTPAMGTSQMYTTLIIEAATLYGHRNVFKHEWGHSILFYFDALGASPQPRVENHAVPNQYVNCKTGGSYVWIDETDANPIPNSIYSNESGFTHDYYSGATALATDPATCLGVPAEAWIGGGPAGRAQSTSGAATGARRER